MSPTACEGNTHCWQKHRCAGIKVSKQGFCQHRAIAAARSADAACRTSGAFPHQLAKAGQVPPDPTLLSVVPQLCMPCTDLSRRSCQCEQVQSCRTCAKQLASEVVPTCFILSARSAINAWFFFPLLHFSIPSPKPSRCWLLPFGGGCTSGRRWALSGVEG